MGMLTEPTDEAFDQAIEESLNSDVDMGGNI
jgi:hypothetical protein